MISKYILVLFLTCISVLLLFLSCGDKSTSLPDIDLDFIRYDISIIDLDIADRWPTWNAALGQGLNFPHDINGVILVEYNNQLYYHPQYLAYYGMRYLASFRETSDTLFLNRAVIYANTLLEMASRVGDCIYLTYDFQYQLHNGRYNEVLIPPWYSGIAQGHGLAFISRLYTATGDPSYLAAADSLFNAFLYNDTDRPEWITTIDPQGYYWIEEYPFEPKTGVLNGFLFAIFGLYEYYQVTGKDLCQIVFRGACSTIKDNVHRFRVPGEVSYYCLLHRSQLSEYHLLAVRQLRYISQITADDFFDSFADSLETDYSP